MRRYLIGFLVLGLMVGSVATAEAKKRPAKREARQETKQKAKQEANQKAKQEAERGPEPQRVERTVEGGYEAPNVPFLYNRCRTTQAWGCISIPTRPHETFVTAKVTDAHGLPIQVNVYADTSYWGQDLKVGTFCGETTEAISFPKGVNLTFWVGPVWPGEARASCPAGSTATSGTIRVTLSNLR